MGCIIAEYLEFKSIRRVFLSYKVNLGIVLFPNAGSFVFSFQRTIWPVFSARIEGSILE